MKAVVAGALAFSLIVGAGTAFTFGMGRFPAGVDTPFERGQFIGQTWGVAAVIVSIIAFAIVRSRAGK